MKTCVSVYLLKITYIVFNTIVFTLLSAVKADEGLGRWKTATSYAASTSSTIFRATKVYPNLHVYVETLEHWKTGTPLSATSYIIYVTYQQKHGTESLSLRCSN